MKISMQSAAAFGAITGLGGMMIGNFGLATTGYVAPALCGGFLGWGMNLQGGTSYPTSYAVLTGAAAALTARLIAGWMTDNADMSTQESAVAALRRAVIGAGLGAATIGLISPRVNAQLLKA